MKVKQYSNSKKEAMLSQADEMLNKGLSTSKIIKELGIASPTYYAWRKRQKSEKTPKVNAKSNALQSNGVKDLVSENARLRNLVVNMALELNELKDV